MIMNAIKAEDNNTDSSYDQSRKMLSQLLYQIGNNSKYEACAVETIRTADIKENCGPNVNIVVKNNP